MQMTKGKVQKLANKLKAAKSQIVKLSRVLGVYSIGTNLENANKLISEYSDANNSLVRVCELSF